jgi:hypothetical protein
MISYYSTPYSGVPTIYSCLFIGNPTSNASGIPFVVLSSNPTTFPNLVLIILIARVVSVSDYYVNRCK